VVGLLFLLAAMKQTRLARALFSALFLYASGINMYLGLTDVGIYQDYASMALPFYKYFIEGWFSHYSYFIIPLIAIGQFFIGFGMLLKGWWVTWACIGSIVFLLAIAPLMVGSGFPFSVVVSLAAYLILEKDEKIYLWQRPHIA
jgi:hypothetical protein